MTQTANVTRAKKKYVIKQLLKKTVENGCTVDEAATALMKAKSMMAKYEITAAEVGYVEPVAVAPAAEPVAEKPAKKAKAKKASKPTGGKRGPAPQYKDHQVITLLVEKNPKREGSMAYARFAKYTSPMTVAQAVEAGLTRDDFRWDVAHGHIEIK